MNKFKQTLRDDLWILLLDIITVNASWFLALTIRSQISYGFDYGASFPVFYSVLLKYMPLYTLLCIAVFALFRLYGGIWRYAGIKDMNRVIWASLVTCAVHIIGTLFCLRATPYDHMPLTYYAFGALFQFFFLCLIRFAYRLFIMEARLSANKPGKALVIGTGELGSQTIRSLADGSFYNVCCVIDTEGAAAGRRYNGIPVYAPGKLEELLSRYSITCVFLAEPSLKGESREKVKQICDANSVEFRDYSAFFNFTGESDQFLGMENVVKGPEQKDGKRRIPFSPPDISEAEIAEVDEALKSGWITTGPRTKLLERRLAAYIETGRADIDTESEPDRWSNRVACLNSATAAEELNLRILGLREGDEVIVPAYTYTASASAAIHCGATVRFVDIQKDGDPVTHMPEMDYDALEAAITEKTKAVITVDLGGIVCDYERVFDIVERKKALFRPLNDHSDAVSNVASRIQHTLGRAAVVCDAAHALGASRVFRGERKCVGAIADFTSFSFHAVKNFTTAEGGAATWLPLPGIDNAELYRLFQLLSLHGQNKDALAKTKVGAWEYDIIGPWYKCNMTDIMAAIGLRQLDRYPGLLERRVEMIKKYDAVCDELGISHMVHHTETMDSSNHLYLIRVPGIDADTRNRIIEKMAERGVATNVHYKPLPMMTAYGNDCSAYPNSYDYYHNLVTLPLHTLLSDADVSYVCSTLREVIKEVRG